MNSGIAVTTLRIIPLRKSHLMSISHNRIILSLQDIQRYRLVRQPPFTSFSNFLQFISCHENIKSLFCQCLDILMGWFYCWGFEKKTSRFDCPAIHRGVTCCLGRIGLTRHFHRCCEVLVVVVVVMGGTTCPPVHHTHTPSSGRTWHYCLNLACHVIGM